MKQTINDIVLALESEGGYIEATLVNDPDGSGMPWFKGTGKRVDLEGRTLLKTEEQSYNGQCIDTAEYYSPAGRIAEELLALAPLATEVMTFSFKEWTGTRTYGGNAIARYYSRVAERTK
ncbi:hypothetical protein HY639_01835 [Candidatus Woesearchaeota archaeon]|nr:hypothetical protein [Candidatus Woesearchaeota archaeon]